MFGGNLEPPKRQNLQKQKGIHRDIQMPSCVSPGVYGHMGRQPNTDYHVRQLHYRQRVRDAHEALVAAESKRLLQESVTAKYDRHYEKKVFQRLVKERFQEKLKAYDENIEERRNKLKELLCEEEKEFIRETIEVAQKGVDSRMEEMKKKAQELKAERERQRLEVVKEKRLMQMIEECKELRPVVIERNLLDTKNSQLQQMRENEMKRQSEKELDNMWYQIMLKEMEAKREREVQELLKRRNIMDETLKVWEKQMQGKKFLREEEERIAQEDRVEMQKLQEQIRREQIEGLDATRRKRDKVARELKEQIEIQEEFIKQRKKEEDEINEAFSKLALEELEKETMKIKDTTLQAKRETAIYRTHLRQLEEERKREEEELNRLLEEHRKLVEAKQQDAYCKLKKARDELHKGRAQQLEWKKQEAENQLKLKEAENELLRMACETNERLQAESDRLQAEEIKQYREELKKQIDENTEKRRLEKEQLERDLAEGLAEEERRRRQVLELINANNERPQFVHPFRRVLETKHCPCPNNM